MVSQQLSPFICHVFVCMNNRNGVSQSCADGDNAAVRAALKQAVVDRGWKGRVRISQSGCLGVCEKGPNVMLYPEGVWFSGVSIDDCETILDVIAGFVDEDSFGD